MKKKLALIGAFLLMSSVAFAEILTVTGKGEYLMSEAETAQVAKQRAIVYAMREAIEKAGVYVRSKSESKNNMLTNDIVKTVAGNILKVSNKDLQATTWGCKKTFNKNMGKGGVKFGGIIHKRKIK